MYLQSYTCYPGRAYKTFSRGLQSFFPTALLGPSLVCMDCHRGGNRPRWDYYSWRRAQNRPSDLWFAGKTNCTTFSTRPNPSLDFHIPAVHRRLMHFSHQALTRGAFRRHACYPGPVGRRNAAPSCLANLAGSFIVSVEASTICSSLPMDFRVCSQIYTLPEMPRHH